MTATLKGGDKIQRYLTDLQAKVAGERRVKVGFLENAKYPNGMPVAQIAAWQEFGTKKIPSRPFFRNMIKDKKAGWGPTVENLLKLHDYDIDKVLTLMGMGIASQLQSSIIELLDPPLSSVTLMLRKMRMNDPSLIVTGKTVAEAAARVAAGESTSGPSTKPLVDSGHLLNSVDYQVE